MVQTANDNDRKIWANQIGQLIFSLNEIDWLLGCIRVDVFKHGRSKAWLGATFSKRLELTAKLAGEARASPAMDELRRLIERTLPLNDVRNHVAHGTLALIGASDDAPRGASFEIVRFDKTVGELRAIGFSDQMEWTLAAIKLSHDFSRFVAMCSQSTQFIAPYEPMVAGSKAPRARRR